MPPPRCMRTRCRRRARKCARGSASVAANVHEVTGLASRFPASGSKYGCYLRPPSRPPLDPL
eukprot:133644-Prorocentrum_minimum.AAC.1